MGAIRKQAQKSLKLRDTLPPGKRDTLLPCPSCASLGGLLIEYTDDTQLRKVCNWCDGVGFTDRVTVKMFRRWQQILKHNKTDKCKITSTTAIRVVGTESDSSE